MELILASRNAHKLRELSALLAPHTLVALPDGVALPPEDAATFADNALGKARAAVAALEVPVIADDSGIESEALGGAPGVRSARFAGEHATDAENLEKLVADVPEGDALTYVCALVYVSMDGTEEVFEGRCTGRLTKRTRGSNGFGYDPAFVPDDLDDGRTMAELDPGQKDAISHRARAAAQLRDWLPSA